MNDFLRRAWINLLGALLIISSLLYLFKYSLDQGWVTDTLKIGIGLTLGAGFAAAGIKWLRTQQLTGEIIAGIGVAMLYTTFAFAGIYYDLWDSMTVFVGVLALTAGASLLAYRAKLRLLMNISLLGALISPLILQPETDQVFTLFLYLLILNCAGFTISLRQGWIELRLTVFTGTWLLYTVYYIAFEPVVTSFWSLPFRYALAAYAFYVLAFLISSWKNNLRFDGLNLYLGAVNAIIFGLWAFVILDGIVPYAYPLFLMGCIYAAMALAVYRLTSTFYTTAVMAKLGGGLLLILLSLVQFGKDWEAKPLINVYLWLIIAIVLLAGGLYKNSNWLKGSAIGVWFGVGCYWYVVTWSAPWGVWFGVYIPFLNWAALAWELLALMGFYCSLRLTFEGLRDEDNRMLATVYSILSHLIVGGLLTIQVTNLIQHYELGAWMDLQLTLSVAWGIYALLLYLWGALSRQAVYRVFGALVLISAAAKALLLDLAGSETLYKVIVLFALGLIAFSIAYINGKWKNSRAAAGHNEDNIA